MTKTDSFGDMLWTKTYGGTDWDAGFAVRITTDSGYIITGESGSSNKGDVYLIKTVPDPANINQKIALGMPMLFSSVVQIHLRIEL